MRNRNAAAEKLEAIYSGKGWTDVSFGLDGPMWIFHPTEKGHTSQATASHSGYSSINVIELMLSQKCIADFANLH
jgi:hypothetical protein